MRGLILATSADREDKAGEEVTSAQALFEIKQSEKVLWKIFRCSLGEESLPFSFIIFFFGSNISGKYRLHHFFSEQKLKTILESYWGSVILF